jgi:hypothetical protein
MFSFQHFSYNNCSIQALLYIYLLRFEYCFTPTANTAEAHWGRLITLYWPQRTSFWSWGIYIIWSLTNPGFEPAIFRSLTQRANRYNTDPTRYMYMYLLCVFKENEFFYAPAPVRSAEIGTPFQVRQENTYMYLSSAHVALLHRGQGSLQRPTTLAELADNNNINKGYISPLSHHWKGIWESLSGIATYTLWIGGGTWSSG